MNPQNYQKSKQVIGLSLAAFLGFSIIVSRTAVGGGFDYLLKANATSAKLTQVSLTAQAQQAPQVLATSSGADKNSSGNGPLLTAQTHSVEKTTLIKDNSANPKPANSSITNTQNAEINTVSISSTATSTVNNTTVYTTQTLALHNKGGDCYVAYQGKVYNVSGQSVWNTCNYGGVAGGADVTANFPGAAYYFTSFPQVGVYQDTSNKTTVANNNTILNNTNNSQNFQNSATSTSSAISLNRQGDDDYLSQNSVGSQTSQTTASGNRRGRKSRNDD